MQSTSNPFSLSESQIKGQLFEKWVVNALDEKHFILHEWRSDKYSRTRYPRSSSKPDLVFEEVESQPKFFFAIECKWRRSLKENEYGFISSSTLKRYSEFEKKLSMPVLVAIGVSGDPDNPEDKYLVPLRVYLQNGVLSKNSLEVYKFPSLNNLGYYIRELLLH